MPTYNFPTRSNGQIIDASHINAVADAVEELGPLVDTAGGGVTVQDEGNTLSTVASTLNFTGAGVTVSGTGANKTITIPGSTGGGSVTVPFYNVKTDFGAAGNGTTDDTAEIQAAIDASHNDPFESIVIFPPGNYRVTNTIFFYNGSKLWGWGSGNTHSGNPKFLWDGPGNTDFWSQVPQATPSNSHDTWFRNIGASKAVTFTGTNGSAITSSGNSFRHGIYFTNRGDRGTLVENCGFQYGEGWGIYFSVGGINTEVRGGRADGMRLGYINFAPGQNSAPNDSLAVRGPWTTDNRIFNEHPTGGGGIYIDQSRKGICYVSIDNGKMELNSPMLPDVGQVTFKLDPTEGTYPQIHASLDTLWVAHASELPNEESLIVTPATDNGVDITMVNCQFRNIVGIPSYSNSRSLIGAGGRHSFTKLGSRGPHVGGSNVEHHLSNFFTPVNMHTPPYMHGKQASIVAKVNPTTGLIAGTTVYDGDLFMTRSGNTVTEHICTSTGTTGTLSGVTASGASGQSFLTLNTSAGLGLDQRITISGTNYTVIKTYGSSVQVTPNLSTTLSGAAVSYKAPSFITRSSTWS